jgi:hypothetical protein
MQCKQQQSNGTDDSRYPHDALTVVQLSMNTTKSPEVTRGIVS